MPEQMLVEDAPIVTTGITEPTLIVKLLLVAVDVVTQDELLVSSTVITSPVTNVLLL